LLISCACWSVKKGFFSMCFALPSWEI